jgi:hypothetical protein
MTETTPNNCILTRTHKKKTPIRRKHCYTTSDLKVHLPETLCQEPSHFGQSDEHMQGLQALARRTYLPLILRDLLWAG